jgi:hypothetical protein
VNSTPARGPLGPGPTFCGPGSKESGLTAPELVVSILFLALLSLAVAPGAFALRESVAIRNAVHETTVAFYLARSYAISRARNVGLKFRKNGDRYEWALYADGNGNGVRTAEIASGVDRYLGIAYPWSRNDVRPAIMRGIRVPDPSTPGRYLDRIDDPIRFNNSDICSFTPVGDATPGSVYLWDAHDRMAVVRVFGATAKIRTLYYRRGARGWTR